MLLSQHHRCAGAARTTTTAATPARCQQHTRRLQHTQQQQHAANHTPIIRRLTVAARAAASSTDESTDEAAAASSAAATAAAAAAPDAGKSSSLKYTQTRARRLSRAWEDSSTPNTGIVALTERSKVGGAAACVVADFKTNRVTRVVPMGEEMTQRAVETLRVAASMLNQNLALDAEREGKAHVMQALAFQPVEIVGDLATPAMPLGSTVLYTSLLRADTSALQQALVRRAAAVEAAEAAEAAAAAAAEPQAQDSRGSNSQQVYIGRNSEFDRVAKALNNVVTREGWAELVCRGRTDYLLPVAMQALVKLRRIRYGVHQDDVSVILLGDEEVLGPNARSNVPQQDGLRPPMSFMVLRCAKNLPNKLLALEPTKRS